MIKLISQTETSFLTHRVAIGLFNVYFSTCDWRKKDANEDAEGCSDVNKHLIVDRPI
jgi:hypothetical protein